MFIRNNSLEKRMSITYADIQRKSAELEMKRETRQDFLRQCAIALSNEFKKSLSLPSDTWTDANGVDHPYIRIGDMNDKGVFERRPTAAFKLDDDLALSFMLSTVIDDTPYNGGPYYLVTVKLYVDGGRLVVDIGRGKKQVIVSSTDEDGAYFEVCEAIKEIIMMGFTDSRLDRV
ncbi:hypothetical protein MW376_004073 [Citrobacter freundii]|nr:hypothetical protein [Citrobacter freundii]EJB8559050.1 hypothetical protein [Citrobacter freundii]